MPRNDPRSVLDQLDRLELMKRPTAPEGRRRQFRRYIARGEATLHPISRRSLDRQPIDVQIRDLGRGGVGFVCTQELWGNSAWRIDFLNRGYSIGQQEIVVRHCSKVDDNLYLIGGQFVCASGLLAEFGVPYHEIEDELDELDKSLQNVEAFLPPSEVA